MEKLLPFFGDVIMMMS